MINRKLISMLCLLCTVLFTSTTFATEPYLLKIILQNSTTTHFVFSSQFPSGNTCTSEGPNAVVCSISGFGPPNMASLTWTSQKTPSCSINIVVMPYASGKTGYSFIHWGTGGGNSSTSGYIYNFPTNWNGASNLSTELVISGVVPGSQCTN